MCEMDVPMFENRAPPRDFLKIHDFAYSKIALPCETAGLFTCFSLNVQKSRSRPEHPENFVVL